MADINKLERSIYGRMEHKDSPLKVNHLARHIKTLNLNHEYYQKLIFESIEEE